MKKLYSLEPIRCRFKSGIILLLLEEETQGKEAA